MALVLMVSDCYSGQSTRDVPSGRVLGWGSQDQEFDGNMKTQGHRQVRAASCVIPYVLCGCLYCLMSDCYSGQSTRDVPGDRVSGWGSQYQELDGNTKTQGLRQVRAAMSVIPYIMCSGLY